RGMKGLPTAAPSFPFKMIIIIGDGIVYFLEVPKLGALITISSRRILIAISSPSPVKHIFAAAYRCLKMLPNTA
ncbi:MAG: hypothetical protein V7K94_29970, partial [Nostoc sp.]|uniref:hypothetical protein n=1 Tax=Nostoc sp. TaxID=1180 RepID=UPI002FF44556